MTGNRAIAMAAAFVGLLIGVGSFTFVREGVLLSHQRSARLRQLSRDAGSLRRLDEKQTSVGRGLQRLPHAAWPRPEVRDESPQRILAFLLFHHRRLSRSPPHY